MKNRMISKTLTAIIAWAVLTQVGAAASDTSDNKDAFEKCYGICKKGGNDCAAAKHSCAGQSAYNNHPNEWIYVPRGTCLKITGGSLEPKKPEFAEK